MVRLLATFTMNFRQRVAAVLTFIFLAGTSFKLTGVMLWICGTTPTIDLEKLLSYPLEFKDFRDLVANFSQGHPTRILPVNLNYLKVNFTSVPFNYCKLPVVLLVVIRSSVRHIERRQEIRRTWANRQHFQKFGLPIRHAFILGKLSPEDAPRSLYLSLEKELESGEDVIVGDFDDTYENLTYKTMMGIRWAKERCPQFQYALLIDDDMQVSIDNLLRFLSNPDKYPDVNRTSTGLYEIPRRKSFYAGQVFGMMRNLPMRPNFMNELLGRKIPRNSVLWSEYPFNVFPPYVSGGAVILSEETLTEFYFSSAFTQHFRIEDVYLGLIALKLVIVPFDASRFIYCCRERDTNCPLDPGTEKFMKDAIAVHKILLKPA